jgi:hypothetical protein
MKDAKDVLREYVGDMLAVEKHTLDSIERQVNDERVKEYWEAYELILKIETTLNEHTQALERYLSSIDKGVGSLLKKAATSATGVVAGIYSRLRPEDPVSRDLRDNYTSLSLAAISYTMLYTTAHALNESKVSNLALKHLNEITPLITEISRVMPNVVAQELSKEKKLDHPSIAKEAVDATQKAWNKETVE